MSLKTFSTFYYDTDINFSQFALDFTEGGPEIQATIDIGSYTPSELVIEVQNKLNEVGANTYNVDFNRESRLVTISANANFNLLSLTGSRAASSVFERLGFLTTVNYTGSNTYTAPNPMGKVYSPQFILQSHISSANFKELVDASVNESANGDIEVVRFGTRSFIQMNIKYANDYTGFTRGPILENPNGVEDLRDFMTYITQKYKIEYMENEAVKSNFEKVLLETTQESSKGTAFTLKEMIGENLPQFFETGLLKFRKVN